MTVGEVVTCLYLTYLGFAATAVHLNRTLVPRGIKLKKTITVDSMQVALVAP